MSAAVFGLTLLVGPALAQTSTPTPGATPAATSQTGQLSLNGSTVTSTGPGGCQLANQAIFLTLSNPNAGDAISSGTIASGIAYDRSATRSPGIDRIQIFLENRENGGIPLSAVTLNQPNPLMTSGPLAQAGFTAALNFPDNTTGPHNIVVYARSATTQQVAVLTMPVVVQGKNSSGNETATPTSVAAPLASCSAPLLTAAMATATPVPASGIAAPAAPSTTASGEPVAADGQTLSSQSAQTQTLFRSVWGASAAQEWVTEHNRSLGR
jgi:hypothetical protein